MPASKAAKTQSKRSVAKADWFRQRGVRAIFAALNRDGHEARVVGGALRNALMGLPVHEVDFAVTAPPDDVIRLATDAGLKAVPTGIHHGTITVVVDGAPFEVTTLRQDVETHGRHATVAFTQDWTADAARRDFTMNALYAGADGRIYDPLGGLPDLYARRVRFIGSARERIREDYLRILRFFRFTAAYSDGPPDPEGLAACIAERAGLARLSAERVRAELLRTLITRNPMHAIEPMAETGLLISILGGVVRPAHFERLAALEARLGAEASPIRRLGALAVMVEEDTARLAMRLRLSNAEAVRLDAIAALEPELLPGMSERDARTALYRIGEQAYRDRALIAWARAGDGSADEAWQQLYRLPERWVPPIFPLKGQDLIARGLKPGPEVGRALHGLEARWIASDFAVGRKDLLAGLKRDPKSGNRFSEKSRHKTNR